MSLRRFAYKRLFPVADEDGTRDIETVGDISDLIRDGNGYLIMDGKIPPVHILNDFFSLGLSDLGMGGGAEWAPFEISHQEFQDLLAYLETEQGKKKFGVNGGIKVETPPAEIKTVEHFSTWRLKVAFEDPTHPIHKSDESSKAWIKEKISSLPKPE